MTCVSLTFSLFCLLPPGSQLPCSKPVYGEVHRARNQGWPPANSQAGTEAPRPTTCEEVNPDHDHLSESGSRPLPLDPSDETPAFPETSITGLREALRQKASRATPGCLTRGKWERRNGVVESSQVWGSFVPQQRVTKTPIHVPDASENVTVRFLGSSSYTKFLKFSLSALNDLKKPDNHSSERQPSLQLSPESLPDLLCRTHLSSQPHLFLLIRRTTRSSSITLVSVLTARFLATFLLDKEP